ncbi:MAG: phosphate ABC transporter permease subunit PstC [Actinomycetota bacterium]|nr:phosphate ABC transporter permease subunit PstC [Actinomycetota bacterium]
MAGVTMEAFGAGGAVETTSVDHVATGEPAPPRRLVVRKGRGDRIFFGGASFSGAFVLAIMVAVGVFLAIQASQALKSSGFSFLTTSVWQPDRGEFGIAAIMLGTVLIALVAVAIALPISMGTALFITEVAPKWLRSWLIALVDLMAAVPSVVYGLWGAYLLQGKIVGLSRWINAWFGWIPFLDVARADPNSPLSSESVYTASTFIAGVVVAMMVMPIQCVVMREVFSQVPLGEREGAYALGSTRWGMIRVVALPFGRGGIIGGTMLGLGRALGETIAVVMIISPRFDLNFHVLEAGSNSVSSHIALLTFESSGFGLSALMAAGLALFAVTLVVNFTASWFVARSRSGASSEA